MRTKYKVGDKVRVIKESQHHLMLIGNECIICEIDKDLNCLLPYMVYNKNISQWVGSKDIEPIKKHLTKVPNPKTHKSLVLKHLQKRTITPLQALNKYGCYRLSSVIERLRKDGHNIITERIGVQGYAKYSLKKLPK